MSFRTSPIENIQGLTLARGAVWVIMSAVADLMAKAVADDSVTCRRSASILESALGATHSPSSSLG